MVTGWESDQVIKGTGGEPDTSIPITWAYNHHYGAYLNGKDSVLEEVTLQGHTDPNGWMGHAHPGEKVWTTCARDDDSNATSRIPVSTVFATGNGGEYRKSFHSYPSGYGQLIESPVSWAIQVGRSPADLLSVSLQLVPVTRCPRYRSRHLLPVISLCKLIPRIGMGQWTSLACRFSQVRTQQSSHRTPARHAQGRTRFTAGFWSARALIESRR